MLGLPPIPPLSAPLAHTVQPAAPAPLPVALGITRLRAPLPQILVNCACLDFFAKLGQTTHSPVLLAPFRRVRGGFLQLSAGGTALQLQGGAALQRGRVDLQEPFVPQIFTALERT